MKKYFSLFVFILSITFANAASTNTYDKQFDTYKGNFILRLWKQYPEWATAIGFHKYDSVLNVPSQKKIQQDNAFTLKEKSKLAVFNVNKLSDLNKIDYYLIDNFLNKCIWENNQLKRWEWNPADYNVGEGFAYILSENYAPLKKRVSDLYMKMKNVPAYYEAAKANIKNPSVEHLNLAIDQNEAIISIFENDFADSVKSLHFYPETEDLYIKRAKAAANSIRSYVQFLKDLKNPNPRSFRLGEKLYAQKFNFDIQSQYSISEIYQAAMQRKNYLHDEMYKITTQLWATYFDKDMPSDKLKAIKMMIDTISYMHVKPENFKKEIEDHLPQLASYVKNKDLVYMDPNKPLKVRKEPGYMAGVAGASMSSPGSYEKGGTAYYNVGTLEGWSPEKAESYLREYNYYILQILNIHEAIPGHYVQLMHANKSPSMIKTIFENGAMVEGWAVYSEYMMLESGYQNSPEMWLMYYKWNLRSVCNTILDISVHTKDMSKDDAMDLLINQAFQQQAEADGKWKRVTLTSVQLDSYFTGFYEILQLRDAYKTKMGNAYSVKTFNDKFLSYGSSPVKYISQMMLGK
ncbi:MAG TPA: DUF885 domain-containing protein [Chitinophagales bacterium]|nr:DUF885 domain-containing protein [Chitinophagales bacterium]